MPATKEQQQAFGSEAEAMHKRAVEKAKKLGSIENPFAFVNAMSPERLKKFLGKEESVMSDVAGLSQALAGGKAALREAAALDRRGQQLTEDKADFAQGGLETTGDLKDPETSVFTFQQKDKAQLVADALRKANIAVDTRYKSERGKVSYILKFPKDKLAMAKQAAKAAGEPMRAEGPLGWVSDKLGIESIQERTADDAFGAFCAKHNLSDHQCTELLQQWERHGRGDIEEFLNKVQREWSRQNMTKHLEVRHGFGESMEDPIHSAVPELGQYSQPEGGLANAGTEYLVSPFGTPAGQVFKDAEIGPNSQEFEPPFAGPGTNPMLSMAGIDDTVISPLAKQSVGGEFDSPMMNDLLQQMNRANMDYDEDPRQGFLPGQVGDLGHTLEVMPGGYDYARFQPQPYAQVTYDQPPSMGRPDATPGKQIEGESIMDELVANLTEEGRAVDRNKKFRNAADNIGQTGNPMHNWTGTLPGEAAPPNYLDGEDEINYPDHYPGMLPDGGTIPDVTATQPKVPRATEGLSVMDELMASLTEGDAQQLAAGLSKLVVLQPQDEASLAALKTAFDQAGVQYVVDQSPTGSPVVAVSQESWISRNWRPLLLGLGATAIAVLSGVALMHWVSQFGGMVPRAIARMALVLGLSRIGSIAGGAAGTLGGAAIGGVAAGANPSATDLRTGIEAGGRAGGELGGIAGTFTGAGLGMGAAHAMLPYAHQLVQSLSVSPEVLSAIRLVQEGHDPRDVARVLLGR